jgi:predicted O-methyltransferase YrrM
MLSQEKINEAVEMAKLVSGHMSEEDLRWLATEAANHNVIIEIGSWKGRSATAMANTTPGYVVCIDHFNGSDNEPTATLKEAKDAGIDGIFKQFLENTKQLRIDGKLHFVRKASEDLTFEDIRTYLHVGKADMIFIDANHAYEHVMREIEFAKKIVKRGGIISGHDFNTCEDVRNAVADSFGNSYKRSEDNIWYVINE